MQKQLTTERGKIYSQKARSQMFEWVVNAFMQAIISNPHFDTMPHRSLLVTQQQNSLFDKLRLENKKKTFSLDQTVFMTCLYILLKNFAINTVFSNNVYSFP